jgi:hypothetical protein
MGFIASYLPPTNINGWGSTCDGTDVSSEPLVLAEGQDPHTIKKFHKWNKCIGVVSDSSNLILGEDLSMEEVVEMADKLVVGKVYGHHFSKKTLKSWVVSTWGASQSQPLQIRRLSRGWFLIIFSQVEQAS